MSLRYLCIGTCAVYTNICWRTCMIECAFAIALLTDARQARHKMRTSLYYASYVYSLFTCMREYESGAHICLRINMFSDEPHTATNTLPHLR